MCKKTKKKSLLFLAFSPSACVLYMCVCMSSCHIQIDNKYLPCRAYFAFAIIRLEMVDYCIKKKKKKKTVKRREETFCMWFCTSAFVVSSLSPCVPYFVWSSQHCSYTNAQIPSKKMEKRFVIILRKGLFWRLWPKIKYFDQILKQFSAIFIKITKFGSH